MDAGARSRRRVVVVRHDSPKRGAATAADTTSAVTPPPRADRSGGRDWRWAIGGVGRVLISVGVLILLFVVYQLWGTALQEAAAQSRLEKEFANQLATTTIPTTVAPTTAPPTTAIGPTSVAPTTVPPTTAPPVTTPARPVYADGDAVAQLEIPSIGLEKIVVAGVSIEDLQKGPGHYPETPLPGEVGNAAIAGHRTTYGAPFARINELEPGEEIIVTTYAGRFVYTVTGTQIVDPSDYGVIANTPEPTITLTSCHPKYSAAQRIIVKGTLNAEASAPVVVPPAADVPVVSEPTTVPEPTSTLAPPASTLPGAETTAPPVTTTVAPPATTVGPAPVAATADAFDRGWFSDDGAWVDVALWGLVLTAIAVGAWLLGRRTKQWIVGPLALIPFIVTLYFFYENVARLLPPNL